MFKERRCICEETVVKQRRKFWPYVFVFSWSRDIKTPRSAKSLTKLALQEEAIWICFPPRIKFCWTWPKRCSAVSSVRQGALRTASCRRCTPMRWKRRFSSPSPSWTRICGKYFTDKDGNKEITKADTVTAKLPDDTKSPQMGDDSNLLLWIALLFISGGAVTATTVYGRKKKRSVK